MGILVNGQLVRIAPLSYIACDGFLAHITLPALPPLQTNSPQSQSWLSLIRGQLSSHGVSFALTSVTSSRLSISLQRVSPITSLSEAWSYFSDLESSLNSLNGEDRRVSCFVNVGSVEEKFLGYARCQADLDHTLN